jgi:hypothetical protein
MLGVFIKKSSEKAPYQNSIFGTAITLRKQNSQTYKKERKFDMFFKIIRVIRFVIPGAMLFSKSSIQF